MTELQREIELLEHLANDPLADINEAYGARVQAYFLRNGYRLIPQLDGRTTQAVHMESGKTSGRVFTNKELYHIKPSAESMLREVRARQNEASILEAAKNNDDHLDEMLTEAIETMDEDQATRLLDKISQIQKEAMRDLRGWKDDNEIPL